MKEVEKMPKQTEKIELRIDAETKQKFIQYANELNTNISNILRNYIKECVICKLNLILAF